MQAICYTFFDYPLECNRTSRLASWYGRPFVSEIIGRTPGRELQTDLKTKAIRFGQYKEEMWMGFNKRLGQKHPSSNLDVGISC